MHAPFPCISTPYQKNNRSNHLFLKRKSPEEEIQLKLSNYVPGKIHVNAQTLCHSNGNMQ